MDQTEKLLKLVLRLTGVVLVLALAAVFLPVRWMAASHSWLGLGQFPESSLTDYLTRSISALYAVQGGLFLLASTDVARFLPVVRYLGLTHVIFGLLILGIDLHAGMPSYWTFVEGPSIVLIGVVVLWLARRLSNAG